jgi:predicted permease
LLTEGVLLSLAGAMIGVPLAYGLTSWIATTDSVSLPLLHYARVDVTALVMTGVIACLTGVVVAVIPAMRVSTQGPQAALQDHSRGSIDSARHAWIRRSLVVGEIALAAILLAGAGLLTRSFVRLVSVELGFEPSRAVAARVDFPPDIKPERRAALSLELRRQVAALPGVEAVGLTDALPLDRSRTWGVGVPDKVYGPGERPEAFVYIVSPGYFPAMGIALTAGRDFADLDSPAAAQTSIIVNETLARQLYPGVDAVGRLVQLGRDTITITGVVADVRQDSLDEAPAYQLYLNLSRGDELIVRTTLPPESMALSLRTTLARLDSSFLVSHVRGLDTLVDRSVSPRRFLISLVGAFSILALILASLGIYGVVSYSVNQRRAEIGVRMALGATGPEVRRQILGETLRLSFLGVALGIGAALLMTRVVESLLFATSPTDPATFGATALILTVVALAAGYIPALRASRLDAMRALRAE